MCCTIYTNDEKCAMVFMLGKLNFYYFCFINHKVVFIFVVHKKAQASRGNRGHQARVM